MSKRLAVKLAVTVAALGAMTLLQGCEGEEDSSVVSNAWTPAGFPWTLYNYMGFGASAGGSSGQASGSSSGGASVGSAIASAAGSGGGGVSTAGAQ